MEYNDDFNEYPYYDDCDNSAIDHEGTYVHYELGWDNETIGDVLDGDPDEY